MAGDISTDSFYFKRHRLNELFNQIQWLDYSSRLPEEQKETEIKSIQEKIRQQILGYASSQIVDHLFYVINPSDTAWIQKQKLAFNKRLKDATTSQGCITPEYSKNLIEESEESNEKKKFSPKI